MIGAVQGRQEAGCTVDLLEFAEVVPGSQVHASVLVHPAVYLESGHKDHGPGEGRTDLEHRAVFLRQARKKRVEVAVSNYAGFSSSLRSETVGIFPRKGSPAKRSGWPVCVRPLRRLTGRSRSILQMNSMRCSDSSSSWNMNRNTSQVLTRQTNDNVSRVGDLVR